MQITAAETMIVEIPFPFPQTGTGIGLNAWRSLEFTLVRLEDERGTVGWGEGFGYSTVEATKAMIDRLLVPRLLAAPVEDVAAWNLETQRALHLHGRYGVTMFAISGVDIALWDLSARRAGVPVHELLRAGDGAGSDRSPRTDFATYASLMRYDEQPLVAQTCEAALAQGYTALKMHERILDSIEAGRRAVGPDVPLATDVNCGYDVTWLQSERARFESFGLAWLEEPIFPPEDYATLHSLRSPELRIAAGDPLGFNQDDVTLLGHAIEVRINAEDPARNFFPSPGKITTLRWPTGPGIRVDAGFDAGAVVTPFYDSLLAKLVVHGASRDEALRRADDALARTEIEGIATTAGLHRALLAAPELAEVRHYTTFIETAPGMLEVRT